MNAHSVVRSTLVVSVLLLGSRVANADCVISGVRPTVPLPTMELGHEFLFIATADCERLHFRVPGTTLTKMPKPGSDTGARDRTYKVRLSESEWDSVLDESDTTFTWSVIGTTSASVTTRVTTTNEIDSDADGWTRSEGDAGACDQARHINPGAAEVCDDGIDNDCDGRACTILDLSVADAKLLGEEPDDLAGLSVSGAGDVDGDGHDDLLVGALNDEGGTGAGAAYLVLGPVTGTLDLSLADAKLVGEEPDDSAGGVSGAGDVNSDGNDDVLVSASANDEGGTSAGAAYLVLGPITGTVDLSLADAKLVGEEVGDFAGTISDAGDVNGDGHDDLLVGANGNDEGGHDAGAAYLVLGPVTGTLDLSFADAKLLGEEARDGAGYSLSGAGDVDGDGQDDVLVGAFGDDEAFPDAGAAYVVLGPVSGTLDLSLADAKLLGEVRNAGAGWSVSDAGDVDGDGHHDLFVGAPWYGRGGAAYLVRGPLTETVDLSLADAKLLGEEPDDRAGYSVSGAGDVDGDGHDDLLIGADYNHQGGSLAGAAYLVLGPVTGTLDLSLADTKLVGEDRDDRAGYSVSGAGDADGDGHDDVLVGAPANDEGATYAGAAYLLYGGGL